MVTGYEAFKYLYFMPTSNEFFHLPIRLATRPSYIEYLKRKQYVLYSMASTKAELTFLISETLFSNGAASGSTSSTSDWSYSVTKSRSPRSALPSAFPLASSFMWSGVNEGNNGWGSFKIFVVLQPPKDGILTETHASCSIYHGLERGDFNFPLSIE